VVVRELANPPQQSTSALSQLVQQFLAKYEIADVQ
jgi:hypothetical protein